MHGCTATIRRVSTGLTDLSRVELRRRIVAARTLRGVSQEELDALFDGDGLGKSAGRLERGDRRLTLNRALLDGLVRHLRVPEIWFTSKDVDALVYRGGTADGERLAAIQEQLGELTRRVQTLDRELLVRVREALRQNAEDDPPEDQSQPPPPP